MIWIVAKFTKLRVAIAGANAARGFGGAIPREDVGSAAQVDGVRSVHANAAALFFTIVSAAGFGYAAWVLAARVTTPAEVGIASAAVSAALLCSNIALLGLGTSVVTFLPRHLENPESLLNSFITAVLAGGLGIGICFVFAAGTFFAELDALGSRLDLAAGFVALVALTAVAMLLDACAIALRRAHLALVRAIVGGAAKLALIAGLWLLGSASSSAIVVAWAGAAAAMAVLGLRQLRSIFPSYRYRIRVRSRELRAAVRNGFANHVLNLSLLAPGLVIPLVVTEVLSATANAFWYAVWMAAALVRIIPTANAQAVFAEVSNQGVSLRIGIRRSLRTSLLVSAGPTLLLVLAAGLVLLPLGDEYAQAGAEPLRILALGTIPQVFIELYLVARRVTGRLAEPIVAFLIAAVLAITAAAAGAEAHGLVGVAVGWLIVQSATGVWAGLRLYQMLSDR